MRGVGERVAAGGPAAVARRYLGRRRLVDLILLGFAALVLGAGIGGFGYLGARASHLASTGVVATATAVAVDNYHRRFQFDAHVVVTFRVDGTVVVARCYTGSGEQFVVGQPVVIVYDPADPTTAQLAGDPQPGPAGVPFFVLTVAGIVLAVPGAYGLWTRRGTKKALRGPGRAATAERAGRRTTIEDSTVTLRGRRPAGPVAVFGTTTIVAVDGTGRVGYGRK